MQRIPRRRTTSRTACSARRILIAARMPNPLKPQVGFKYFILSLGRRKMDCLQTETKMIKMISQTRQQIGFEYFILSTGSTRLRVDRRCADEGRIGSRARITMAYKMTASEARCHTGNRLHERRPRTTSTTAESESVIGRLGHTRPKGPKGR